MVTEVKNPNLAEGQNPTPDPRPLTPRNEVWIAILFLLAMLLLKGAVAFWLYRTGYLEYDGDGFTRSVHAWEWLQKPRFEIDAWLPLQFWLNGGLMAIFPDLFFVPRIVNMLASCVTVISFFFIGRWLFGRLTGYASAAAVAIFPWEIWFGMSGMAESMTHMFLSLGVLFLVRWLHTRHTVTLLWASFGFLGATALRYEAWFYSAVYAGIVLYLTFRGQGSGVRGQRNPKSNLLLVSVAFWFAAVWMLVSWVQKGSPFAFVSITSEINANLEGRNTDYSLWERLIFYPRTFFDLMPRLVIPAILGSLWLVWKPVGVARAYLMLVWGEFALFILSTLPFNNIAPGSARYPVSNLMLLLPVVAWLFVFLAQLITAKRFFASLRMTLYGRWLLAVVFGLLLASFVQSTITRDLGFPDGDTRQLVLKLKELTDNGTLPPKIIIPVHFPNPLAPNGGDFGRIYAIETLTNRPQMKVISEIDGFEVHLRDDKSLAWLHIDTAGDDEAIKKLSEGYHHNVQIGRYLLSYGSLNRPLAVTPNIGDIKQVFTFIGEDFEPDEKVSVWVSLSATDVRNQTPVFADSKGRVSVRFTAPASGTMALTARGDKSGRTAVAEISVK